VREGERDDEVGGGEWTERDPSALTRVWWYARGGRAVWSGDAGVAGGGGG
jgi:hypothetical protein